MGLQVQGRTETGVILQVITGLALAFVRSRSVDTVAVDARDGFAFINVYQITFNLIVLILHVNYN